MPARLRAFLARLRASVTPGGVNDGFDHELEAHLSLLTEKFIREGVPPEEAVYAARRKLGGLTQLQQIHNESLRFPWIEEFLQDLRQALRMLAKSPGFALTAIVTLALGIGANSAIFSVINAVLLKPVNAPDADRLVRLLTSDYGSLPYASFPQYNLWSQQTTSFEEVSAHRSDVVNLTGGAHPEQIPLARVTSNFFRLFNAPILLGRGFAPGEDRPGGPSVVLLSYELWTRRFAGDPHVSGKTMTLGNIPYTIVGVLGRDFDTEQFDARPQAWVPLQIDPSTTEHGDYCTVTARLKPDVTLATANAEMAVLAEEYQAMLANANWKFTFTVRPLQQAMGFDARPSLMLLLGAVTFVLLIACANVANLLLVRAIGRKREIAIRVAVGAGRGRIVRQLITESLVLSAFGGALGLALGILAMRAVLVLYPGIVPRVGEHAAGIAVDLRVLLFTVLLSLLSGILFGVAPALQAARTDLTVALKESGSRRGTGPGQHRLRSWFVAGETALALVLLVGAALLIRSYVALHSVAPGFETRRVLTTQMSLTGTRFERTAAMQQLVQQGAQRLRALPGIENAGAACCIPLETVWQLSFIVEGRPLTGRDHGFAGWTFISPEYFDVFKIPVVRGRAFTDRDTAGAPGVVIINRAMAQRVWPDSDPLQARLLIGRTVRPEYYGDPARQIVGIVGDVRDTGLNSAPRPAMYVPIAQLPDEVNVINLRLLPLAWFIRAPALSEALDSAIQNALEDASGGLPPARIRSMEEVSTRSTARRQFETLLMVLLGCSALLLAAVGIYGLMAYSVQQRTQEIGIRIALGATRQSVRNMIILEGIRVALLGEAAGIAAALGLSRLLVSFLFGVQPRDPAAFIIGPLFLSAIALLAVWLPAHRATAVNPVDALRCE